MIKKSKYYDISEELKNIKDKDIIIPLCSIKNEYISNGFRDTIKNIQYAIHFESNKLLKNKTLKELLPKYKYQTTKIYTTLHRNQKIIIGNGLIYENNLEYGYCNTIDSIQGEECENCIFIIPNDIQIFNNFYNSRRLLVALTRSTKRLYILYNKIEYKNLKNTNPIKLKDDKYISFTEMLQIMSLNKSNSRNSILNLLLKKIH